MAKTCAHYCEISELVDKKAANRTDLQLFFVADSQPRVIQGANSLDDERRVLLLDVGRSQEPNEFSMRRGTRERERQLGSGRSCGRPCRGDEGLGFSLDNLVV